MRKFFDKYFVWIYTNSYDLPVEFKLPARKAGRGTYELQDGSWVRIWKGRARFLKLGKLLKTDLKFLFLTDNIMDEDKVEEFLTKDIYKTWWKNCYIEADVERGKFLEDIFEKLLESVKELNEN